MFFVILILFIVAYLLGSIPFGLILTKIFKGVDLRKIGSGNIGTTNVLRTGNKTLALVTLLCDMGKGGIPILVIFGGLPALQSNEYMGTEFNIFMALTIGFGAIIGHCFPVWLKFKGGKGVATTFGVLLAAVPYSGLIAIATWLMIAFTTRYSSLAALCAYAIAPVATFFIYGTLPAAICVIISVFVWIRHKDNIKHLLSGTESKIGQKENKKDHE